MTDDQIRLLAAQMATQILSGSGASVEHVAGVVVFLTLHLRSGPAVQQAPQTGNNVSPLKPVS